METLPDGAIYGGQSRGRGEVIGRNYVMLLKDRVYRNSFKDAINEILKEHIQDKVVIDVGCGTGYFSILCAMAGAKRVYAVEPSTMALEAKKAVVDNGLSDKVTVIYSRVENIKIEEKVDVIVSDWTDHYIIYKSMLDSFFKVRDQFLKCDGLIFPSMAKLYMAPVTTTVKYKKQQRFWRNVCGINMSSIFQLVRKRAFEKPSVENIDTRTLLASPQVVMQLDCYRTEVSDLKSFKSAFCFNSLIPATEEDVGHIDLNRPPQIHVATLHHY